LPEGLIKGNILPMSTPSTWLELGLADLPPEQAERVRLLRALFATAGLLRGHLDRALAPAGITSQQAMLLQFVEAQLQAPALSFVARSLNMSHQNVKQIALGLQRKGFLEIEVDASDRRTRRLHLTEHHYRFWKDRNPADFSSVEEWTSALSDPEVSTAVELLAKLNAGNVL
jgi:DNA-binding MarR family transcriptional regulator